MLWTDAEHLIGQSGNMSRREQLQQQLTAAVHVRQDLRREQDRAQRILTRVSATRRVDRRGVSLVVLRLVADIAGLQPTAVLVSRRLLKRSAPGADHIDAEAAALQALLDAPRCVAGAARVRHAGDTNKIWCKALRLAAEVQVLRILLEANRRGGSMSGKQLLDHLAENWPPQGAGRAFAQVVMTLRLSLQKRKRWLRVFRLFWGISYKRMGARPFVAPELQSQRVFGPEECFISHLWGPKKGPFSGLIFGACTHISIHTDLFLGSKNGSGFGTSSSTKKMLEAGRNNAHVGAVVAVPCAGWQTHCDHQHRRNSIGQTDDESSGLRIGNSRPHGTRMACPHHYARKSRPCNALGSSDRLSRVAKVFAAVCLDERQCAHKRGQGQVKAYGAASAVVSRIGWLGNH